jgi:hypothetical protein
MLSSPPTVEFGAGVLCDITPQGASTSTMKKRITRARNFAMQSIPDQISLKHATSDSYNHGRHGME